MELFINVVVCIFSIIGIFVTVLLVFAKYIIINEEFNDKNYILKKGSINIRYRKK